MTDADRMLGMYLHLARASNVRRQPMIHDKMLLLAGVQAEEMGLDPIAALCRHKVLGHNAQHLVRQWPTLAAALADDEFQTYLKQLKRRFSREKIEHMVQSLGIEMGREREAYFSDLEYAAALLDTRPEAIADLLAQDPKRLHDAVRPRRQALAAELLDALRPRAARRLLDLPIVWGALLVGLLVLLALVLYWRNGAR